MDYHLAFHSTPYVVSVLNYESDSLDFGHILGPRQIELGYMLEGCATAQAEDEKEPLEVPEDSVLIEVHDRYHRFRCSGYHKEYSIKFDVSYTHVTEKGIMLPRLLPLGTPDNPIRQMFTELYTQYTMDASSPMNISLLIRLLGEISFTAQKRMQDDIHSQNWYIHHATKYIVENLNEHLQIPDIAAYMNISTGYLSRLFREAKGITLIAYINQLRVQQIENMILRQGMSVREAGQHVGLCDPNYVSRLFRRVRGYSITELRRLYTEQNFSENK